MSKKGWPKWLTIRFSDSSYSQIQGYRGSVNNKKHFQDVMERNNISKINLLELKVNDITLDEQEIDKIFQWLNE